MNKAPPKKPEKHDPDETVKITPEQVAKLKSEDSEQIERAVEHAHVLEDGRVGHRLVLPHHPVEARRHDIEGLVSAIRKFFGAEQDDE